MLQRKDGQPTYKQAADNENEAGNEKERGSISQVPNPLKAEEDANMNRYCNGDP